MSNVIFSAIPSAGVPVSIIDRGRVVQSVVPQQVLVSDPQNQVYAILVLVPKDGGGVELHEISGTVESWSQFADRHAVKIVGGAVALGTVLLGGLATGVISLPSITGSDDDQDQPLS